MSGAGSIRFLKNLVFSRPEHDSAIKALGVVLERVEAALPLRADDALSSTPPRVVTHVPPDFPLSLVIDCYQAGLRHFGEKTAHELIRKAENEDVLKHCPEIRWHFYGAIQPSVATSRLVKTANLYMIESVHNETIATVLDRSAGEKRDPLKVMVQVAASEEEEKLGLTPSSSSNRLCRHIVEDCPHLELCGLMIHPSPRRADNESANNGNAATDPFQVLTTARLDVCRTLQVEVEDFQLSMGGTWDYERAIELGSSNVRIALDELGISAPVVPSAAEDEMDSKSN